MIRPGMMIAALALLAACGDPLAGVPRISDLDIVETDPVAQALPTDAEIAREGFFGTDAARTGTTAATEAVDTQESNRRGGFLGLFSRAAAGPTVVPAEGGSTEVAGAETNAAEEESTRVASLEPETAQPAQSGLFSGLLGGGTSPRPGDDILDVAHGTVLPYGVIARSCETKRRSLGKKVESSASGFKLYDTNPGISGQRTYYITGFADGCPRQLTAANVLLGAPSFYELLHYGPAGAHLPVGETDRAYEKVKRQVCGSGKGKPCGSRIKSLERNTVFVNAYARPKDNTSWSEMLIHDGEVLATTEKSSG